jgi:ABC-type lipoprotein export system ATPase subunit
MTGVRARGLIAVYPDPAGPVAALRGLDLDVGIGELAAIVGPSGSGKTTLLRLLGGLERPTAGSLEVLGFALASAPDRARRRYRRETVAIVEQHYRATLSPYQSIRRSVAMPLAIRGVPVGERDRRVDELLQRVGLGRRGESLPVELSGGEQQRVAVAAALVTGPRLLLADEPTGELDGRTAEDLLSLLRELVRETGTTAVVVTHDEAVERIADRTVHLRDGRAIAERQGTSLTALDDALGWHAPPLRRDAKAGLGAAPRDETPTEPAAAIAAAVRLDGVSRIYGGSSTGARAVEDVSFALGEGGFHVVSGPSGAGKSTLLRLIAGLDDPTAGSIETLGTPMATLDREGRARFRARRLGIVDQGRGLTPFLTSVENVALVLAIHGWDPATAREHALAALEAVGLAALADRQPRSLSAGERTRVSIARALASEPELILLDEPTATLDRASADRIGELLAGLAGPRTIVAATHDRALMDRATDGYVLD